MNYDVIVIGAGTAGAVASKRISEKGYNVALLDLKDKSQIGNKVCGDAIGHHHFEELKIKPPQKGEDLEMLVDGVEIFSPNKQTKFTVGGDYMGYIINRHIFGQKLLNEALDAGAQLFDNHKVLTLSRKNLYEIQARNRIDNNLISFFAPIIIDGSGQAGIIRKKVPYFMEDPVLPEEVEVCYREIRQLKTGDLDNPSYLKIYLNSSQVPGGYIWHFPEGNGKINIGLGVQMKKGHANPKDLFNKYVHPIFKESKIIHAGGGMVPTRRPIWSLVSDGILLIGDAACTVNPIHGGGIGSGMQSAVHAANAIVSYFETENLDELWKYNVAYSKGYGQKQAQLDIFRLLLQRLDDQDLNWGMEKKLIKEEDVLKASLGEGLNLNITDKIKRFFKGIRKVSLLNRLRKVAKSMKQIKELYINYPNSLNELDPWKKEVLKIYEETNKLFD
ncbi:MAG: geranylgeranyl reductase family protein [Candidatus Lokiarchaeota archaeon]|nr:geranylgeranyl reductase family protein [Candidatus Lokiarchaeota archaeon]